MPLLKTPTKSQYKNSCDGEPLSSYAAKMPAAPKSGNVSIDRVRHMQRDAFQRIVDQLQKYPEYIMPIQSTLLSEDLLVENKVPDKNDWTGEYTTLQRLPPGWKLEFLYKLAQKEGARIPYSKLEAISKSTDLLDMLFGYALQYNVTLAFPSEMAERRVASIVLQRRAASVGKRLTHLCSEGAFATPGQVSFEKACFRLVKEGERVTRIIHCSGVEALVPPHAPIDTSFRLIDNHYDHLARVEKKPSVYFLKVFFADDVGFRIGMQTPGKNITGLQTLASSVAEELQAEETMKDQEVVAVNVEVAKSNAQETAKNNLAKARTKIDENQQARKRRRTIALA